MGAVTPLAVANYWSEAKGTRGLGKGEIEPSSVQVSGAQPIACTPPSTWMISPVVFGNQSDNRATAA